MTQHAGITFLIRTYNEGQFIAQLLDTLDSQEGVFVPCQTTVVDSGSRDETVAIARSRGVNLIEISPEAFDYSKALNLGIAASHGGLIVILSAHAIPCTATWLARMVSHFADPEVAGVYSRQVPWPGASWREVVRLARIFGDSSIVFERGRTAGDVPFSNAASCIRRSAWEAHPFTLPAAEDIEWATWAVGHGHKVVYDATVSVHHSHDESARQEARRLIRLEQAADIRLARPRGLLLTVKQGAGLAVRDFKEIRRYTPATLSRLRILGNSVARSFWFVRDFGAI